MIDQTFQSASQRSNRVSLSTFLVDSLSLTLIILPAIYVALANLHNTYDDAFITYRYAYNFATGNGFVYNGGEWYMGTTAPLYGLILGGLGFVINPEAIPAISGWISGVSLLLTGVALYVYGRLHDQPFCGLLAGLFFVTSPLLLITFGGEMLFQLALVAWAFVAYRLERNVLAAVFLALAILTRADGVIAAGVIGAHYLVTRRRLPWRELLVMVGILLPFMVLAWVYYGSPLPGTLEAKLAQRDSGFWAGFSHGMVEWLRAFTMQGSSTLYPNLPAAPHAIRFVLFVALGIPALVLFRFWLLPLAWVALYFLGYHLLNVPFYHWYIVPVVFALMILAASGIAGVVALIVRLYRRFSPTPSAAWVTGILAALCVLALLPGIYAQLQDIQRLGLEPNPPEVQYVATGRWLEAHTPPDASVGYFEIGHLGYYARRTLIDPLGLVNPHVAAHVARREWTWAYAHYRPDYIVHHPVIFAPYIGKVIEEPWFKQEYMEVVRIPGQGIADLIVYQRVAAVP